MTKNEKYLFGPVASRRLGLSLGVDIVPLKVCTLDCVYCQLGKSSEKITERKAYVDIDELLGELKNRIEKGLGVVVPVANLLEGPSIVQFATNILAQLGDVDSSVSPRITAEPADSDEWESMEI